MNSSLPAYMLSRDSVVDRHGQVARLAHVALEEVGDGGEVVARDLQEAVQVVDVRLPGVTADVDLDVLGRGLLAGRRQERVEPGLVEVQVLVGVLHVALVVIQAVVPGQLLGLLERLVVGHPGRGVLDLELVEDLLVVEQHVLVDEQRHAVDPAVGARPGQLHGGLVQRVQVDARLLEVGGEVADPAHRLQVAVDAVLRVLDDEVGGDPGLLEVLVPHGVVPRRVLDLDVGERRAQLVADDLVEDPRRGPPARPRRSPRTACSWRRR
ncbi:hypothetical protein [Nonomuraea rubra]|uniref:hypothetical protein n=1 Tax=Nonomuraea rubra TaxID=46180 RepID=UPI003CD09B50